jgi:NAD(P)-dependent dehydrogenase (short-subunit alcohol dehydrogenase family)
MADSSRWALILGASSGFGEATSLELARTGYDIIGVHLDRKSTMPHVEEVIGGVRAEGRAAVFFNVNAADPERRSEVVAHAKSEFQDALTGGVLLHSLAFGNLRPYIAEDPNEAITPAQMDMTLSVMAHSLVYWTQDLVLAGLLRRGGKVFAMTSAGATRALPHYGAVSAAKAALEAHVRQLAVELAPRGIAVNAIRAGVTDTPALRKIPGHELISDNAQSRNPSGRLTTTQDVARAIVALCRLGTEWMTGNVFGVDGGEDLVG